MNHQSNDLGIPHRVNSSIRWYESAESLDPRVREDDE
jgi:hypothetical protein